MYFTDCKFITQVNELDVQRFKGFKAVGFISITSSAWNNSAAADRLMFLEHLLVHQNDCFFYVSTQWDAREKFINNLQQFDAGFNMPKGQDFVAYFRTDNIKFKETDIFIKRLPSSIDETLVEIEETMRELKFENFVARVQIDFIKKTGLFLFEILKKLASL